LIQDDLAAASKATDPYGILLPAGRSLLITRGMDSGDPDIVFRNFEEHFVNTGLVGEEFRPLLLRALGHVQGWKEALQTVNGESARLLDRIKLLISMLDANLKFHPPEKDASQQNPINKLPAKEAASEKAHGLDLRGVRCPMNFVKAKLKLEGLAVGETLELVLDDGPPIQNVPASFKAEGQEISSMTQTGDGHWRVNIRKMHL
jgi:sulfite reductase (ferredoxin)